MVDERREVGEGGGLAETFIAKVRVNKRYFSPQQLGHDGSAVRR